jgi:hypothetical protein
MLNEQRAIIIMRFKYLDSYFYLLTDHGVQRDMYQAQSI